MNLPNKLSRCLSCQKGVKLPAFVPTGNSASSSCGIAHRKTFLLRVQHIPAYIANENQMSRSRLERKLRLSMIIKAKTLNSVWIL